MINLIIISNKMITILSIIVLVIYFYQYYVYFAETTYLLFSLFCSAHNPTILSPLFQIVKKFSMVSIQSHLYNWVIIDTVFQMTRWRWTLMINLPNNQNSEILHYDTRLFLYHKYLHIIYIRFFNKKISKSFRVT